MINIKKFVFNPFQVNTYVLWDETKECIIIDAACYEDFEKSELIDFIKTNGLNPVMQINTHCHIDHVLGNNAIFENFKILPTIHKAGEIFYSSAHKQALNYGFKADELYETDKFCVEGDIIKFGNSTLEILYTPGHADGSICLVSKDQKFVIVGDVLFHDSIGRTDFPTGNHNLLINNIKNKLFTLGDDFTVYTGHGPETNIGYERVNNPYLS
ncbi:MAG: MBL fold metallo-hydrolase [Bacteroidales bacterium]|nr:MBL fold metallo-hydrolase [Bacteroidales bacterium]